MVEFIHLQTQLRHAVSARITSGQITGLSLARKTGFQQAHISNFMHDRRGLSLEGMDRVMKVLGLSVLDLIPAGALASHSGDSTDREYEGIALLSATVLADPIPSHAAIIERLKFKRAFLRRLRSDLVSPRSNWTRFVLFKP
jgi:transcriptional regulator with XRE-family HTH domain